MRRKWKFNQTKSTPAQFAYLTGRFRLAFKKFSMKFLFAVLLVVTAFFPAPAQETQPEIPLSAENFQKIKTIEDTLVILAYAMVNDSTPDNRFASCRQFIRNFVRALKVENSFYYPFERLRTISQLHPADSTFRIFTWQVYVDTDNYHYYGTIQMNSPTLQMTPLIDRSEDVQNLLSAELTPENWYGALYYKIEEFDTPSGKKYLLFGFDGYRFFSKRKLIDVLTFQNGNARFGAPVFETESKNLQHRWLLEYGSDASVRLNYDDNLQMVVFDHLVETGSPYPGQGAMNIPDGDIDGLFLEKGVWKFKARVFDQTMDEAPRPMPVLDDKSKDIFGKPKKD